MFNISEAGAAAYDWLLGKIQGFDTTDPVEGGVTGVDNIPLTSLALRTRNIHDRLKTLEDMLIADSDSVINNLRDILDAFSGETEQVALIGLLARKACNVSSTADKASWVAAIEIAKRTYNLNTTEKATWVAGLELAQRICNLTTQAEIDSWFSTLGIANGQQDFANWKADIDSTMYWYASKNATNLVGTHPSGGGAYDYRADWRNTLGLMTGYILIGRCEINWGDVGLGGISWKSIGYNAGILGVCSYGGGTGSTYILGGASYFVGPGQTMYEIYLSRTVNIHKCLVHMDFEDQFVGNLQILRSSNPVSNKMYVVLKEPSGGARNEFGHIHIVAGINDYI